ncbi:MAG: monovalent cation/H(+) antiporter subunit G [Bacteroidales bacterium]|nr:monovalent cation/H(+) antiporter subunit G [Bacteroidales bacterium]MDD4217060.1 monovalent cation/H(+) antiporter subunit G [Bacteroidales bacterium]MDY0142500.1 monovalent cation/H(+) antiporter subunit G [Bacteroidales bacterium]
METLKLIGAIIVLLGSIFLLLGSLGLVRMPDLFTRIQAGTKASTLGTMLTLVGIIFITPNWTGKLIILILFVLITNPISSHVLARAAHFSKIKLSDKTIIDQLADDGIEDKEKEKINNNKE